MDVPLALNHIEIRQGLIGNKIKSSSFGLLADVVGLSAFIMNLCHIEGYNMTFYSIDNKNI